MWGTVISFTFNIALDYLLMQRLGVAGIALSTSLVYAAAFTFLALMTFSRLKRAEADRLDKLCD
jgi:Na+-driven multidrug efflux pump